MTLVGKAVAGRDNISSKRIKSPGEHVLPALENYFHNEDIEEETLESIVDILATIPAFAQPCFFLKSSGGQCPGGTGWPVSWIKALFGPVF